MHKKKKRDSLKDWRFSRFKKFDCKDTTKN